MSLQQILAEHSRNISDNIGHAQDIATENADRKANDLEEKFQHVKDSIEGAGGEIAAIGGAYHMGRKIYKKVQQARQAAKAIRGTGSEASSDIPIDLPEGTSEAGGSQSSRPTTGEGEEPNPEAHTTEEPSEAGEASGETEPVQPEQAEDPVSGGGGDEGAEIEREAAQRQAVDDATKGEFPERGPSSGQPSGDLARNTQGGADEGAQAAEGGAKEARTVASVADEAADTGAAEAGDVGSALGRAGAEALGRGTSALVVNNADTATQAASKIAGLGGDALSAGLDTASAVLDALGPVGEVAGVITSLVGLFEGLGHKKKDVEETGEAASAGGPITAAVDPKALQMTATM